MWGGGTCGGPRYFMTASTTLEPIIMHAMKHPNTCTRHRVRHHPRQRSEIRAETRVPRPETRDQRPEIRDQP
eukprot:2405584-Rhodomonas_salina.1